MFTTIQSIHRDAGLSASPDAAQVRYEQLPLLASAIVGKAADIDELIDRTHRETFLGRETSEIEGMLVDMMADYERGVDELREMCVRAEQWVAKIHSMQSVIASNTPWISGPRDGLA